MLRHTVGRLPLWLARTIAVTAVVLLVVGVLTGVVFRGFIAVSNAAFSVKDTTTDAGAVQPTAPERSGSPASLIAWDTLGRQGRNFVARGPTRAQIAEFTGRPAMVPVRVYAGSAVRAVRPGAGRPRSSRSCVGPGVSTARRWSS